MLLLWSVAVVSMLSEHEQVRKCVASESVSNSAVDV